MKNILILIAGLVLLGGLFWAMKPAATPVAATVPNPPALLAAAPQQPAPAPVPPTPVGPVPQVFEVVVKAKQRVSGPAVISVPQGTPVTLRITTDHHDELHLHGYDLTLKLPTAEAAELSFIADRSGRFEYELHHAHVDLGVLEVQPQ